MILTTHILTGAVIGKNLENPWVIVAASVALHFLLDTFRHGEYLNQQSKWKDFWKVAVDLVIGFSTLFIIIYFSDFTQMKISAILLGSFFSIFPDFLTLLNWKLGVKFLTKYYAFHGWLHKYPRFSKERDFNLRNARNDILLSLLAALLLFF